MKTVLNTLVFVTILNYGCSLSHSKNESSETENLSYDFTQNGCATGKQSFSSKTDYCAGLLNDDLNHHCALSMREKTYQSACGELPRNNFSPDESQE